MIVLSAILVLALGQDSLLQVDRLSKGQEIEIEIESSGCFHHTKSHIKVSGGTKRYLTFYQSLEGKRFSPSENKEPTDLFYDGPLTKEMERQIGLTLDYYREVSNKNGGCTTQEN